MLWLVVAISSYLILAIVFLVDKYLLIGPIPNPKTYVFFVGTLGILVLILAPFVGFYVPSTGQIILGLATGMIFIYALFWFYKALRLFEPSRVVPAIGGMLPIFTLLLIYILSRGKEILNFQEFLALFLLIFGSFLIVYEKTKRISLKSLKISAITAFFLALAFVFTKYVYLAQSFWSGYIWIRIGGFLMALLFLLTKEVRSELIKAKVTPFKKTAIIFLSNQAAGAGANILQNWAIALAPIVYLTLVNALQGIQYAFLLIFTIFLSLKFPRILKEKISKEVIFQKTIAILLIGAGLAILAIK